MGDDKAPSGNAGEIDLGFSVRGRFIRLPTPLGRLVRRGAFDTLARITRGATLGVRGVVRDCEGRVLLIKHSYTPGWYLPGGGVERREHAEEALARELKEEANVDLAGPVRLHGVFTNFAVLPSDHVFVYLVDAWRQPEPPQPNSEIIAHGFFAPDALPQDTTGGTRRRLAELIQGAPPSRTW